MCWRCGDVGFAAEGCSSLQPRSPLIRHNKANPGGSLAYCLAPGSCGSDWR